MDNTEVPVHLMRVTMDGELVAEVPIIIYNPAKAMEAFSASFSELVPHAIGELFQAMRIACDPELQAQFGHYTGLEVNIAKKGTPQLVIPNGFPGGF